MASKQASESNQCIQDCGRVESLDASVEERVLYMYQELKVVSCLPWCFNSSGVVKMTLFMRRYRSEVNPPTSKTDYDAWKF